VTDPLHAQRERRRAAKGRVKPPAEELHEPPKLPSLVTQGARSPAPRPRPPTPDDWLRSAARDAFASLRHRGVP
jgi:hypothetical protein